MKNPIRKSVQLQMLKAARSTLQSSMYVKQAALSVLVRKILYIEMIQ
jgi:hypothetical protein